ncbi:MAG: ChaN family lipoprotein [Bacteroidota bacterium]|jgi:uncharacterized iron-regulated protein
MENRKSGTNIRIDKYKSTATMNPAQYSQNPLFSVLIQPFTPQPIFGWAVGLMLAFVSLFAPSAIAQATKTGVEQPKYTSSDQPMQLFDAKGKKITYTQWLQTLKKELNPTVPTIILFGELHDNPLVHWLQLQTTQDLYMISPNMALGAEMFETDQQLALNEYLKPTDTSAQKTQTSVSPMGAMFGQDPHYTKLKNAVKLWPNFKTDYKPLVDFAKENDLPFIATNVPRKYANLVYRGGVKALDTLSAEQKSLCPPLPFPYDSTLTCYADIFKATGGHGGQNLPMSQAIKDAAMAWNIMQNLQPSIGPEAGNGSRISNTTNYSNLTPQPRIFIHYNGTYHSDNHQSIEWYLQTYAADQGKISNLPLKINVVTIGARTQSQVKKLDAENKNIADLIIVTIDNITKTH